VQQRNLPVNLILTLFPDLRKIPRDRKSLPFKIKSVTIHQHKIFFSFALTHSNLSTFISWKSSSLDYLNFCWTATDPAPRLHIVDVDLVVMPFWAAFNTRSFKSGYFRLHFGKFDGETRILTQQMYKLTNWINYIVLQRR
jgi:hypothetical protein